MLELIGAKHTETAADSQCARARVGRGRLFIAISMTGSANGIGESDRMCNSQLFLSEEACVFELFIPYQSD